MWIQTRGAKIRVKLDKNLENSSISNRKKQFIGFFERIFSSDETVDKVSALLYVGCVLLGRVLQAAGLAFLGGLGARWATLLPAARAACVAAWGVLLPAESRSKLYERQKKQAIARSKQN